MATLEQAYGISEDSSKSNSEWYEVENSEQIAFYKSENGDSFYITDTHEGRLRPSGWQYSAVYVDRAKGERKAATFNSLEDTEHLGIVENLGLEQTVANSLNQS